MSDELDRAIVSACSAMADFAVLRPVAERLERAWKASKASKAPVERTPETVLRAMLKAYEAAALDAEVSYFRASPESAEEYKAEKRMRILGSDVPAIREEAARATACPDDANTLNDRLRADYEARLSGARPLDAPPMEEQS